jgi:hypothetical protein
MHNPFADDIPDYSAFATVDDWLASIKMSRYAENFALVRILSLLAFNKTKAKLLNLSRILENTCLN